MSVPLDRLYNFLHDVVNHDITIYRFWPHGSKKLEHLKPLVENKHWFLHMTSPPIIFHDQEPLNFAHWTTEDFVQHWKNHVINYELNPLLHLDSQQANYQTSLHLRGLIDKNLYDYVLLVHSEKNSQAIHTYGQHGFLPVYYWAHAMIAADWFRYAVHDPVLQYDTHKFTQDFLIYNRAWSGTREYRLYFLDQVVRAGLTKHCRTSFSPEDSGVHHSQHVFVNPRLSIGTTDLDTVLPLNTHNSDASADYNNQDYAQTGIEIVLETLFDDDRWHLTEKALRPIACGKPFMLVATAGSLKYLRSYGFETFDDFIDESYDLETDPVARLSAVIQEMARISALSSTDKIVLWRRLHLIAARNKQRFFSSEWQTGIVQEYLDNMNQALTTVNQHCTGKHWEQAKNINRGRSPDELEQISSYLKSRQNSIPI